MKGGIIYEDGSRTKEAAVGRRRGCVVMQTPDLDGLQEFSAISVKVLMQKN